MKEVGAIAGAAEDAEAKSPFEVTNQEGLLCVTLLRLRLLLSDLSSWETIRVVEFVLFTTEDGKWGCDKSDCVLAASQKFLGGK